MPKVTVPPLTLELDPEHPVLGRGNGDYSYAIIGEPGGLTQFGAHVEVLSPGAKSSFRHWHETEDEMVYVLSGEVVLIEDEDSILRAGDAACWPAGRRIGHCLENRTALPATYLTIGTRNHRDVIHHPDHDMITYKDGQSRKYTHADGTPRTLGENE